MLVDRGQRRHPFDGRRGIRRERRFATSGGHAWVVDGYRHVDACAHVHCYYGRMNWGWDGRYNGWYLMNDRTPGVHEYSYFKRLVVGIYPRPVTPPSPTGCSSSQKCCEPGANGTCAVCVPSAAACP